jgi:hypothetical protein
MEDIMNTANLPATNGGSDNRFIKGERLKFVDGRWSSAHGGKFDETTRFLVFGTKKAAQMWEDGVPTVIPETPDTPLDVDAMNEAVPREAWVQGKFDSEPKPPWTEVRAVYLTRIPDCSPFTFVSGTKGTAIAVGRLHDRIETYQALRGANAVPIVSLESKSMKTAWGEKLRPEFVVQDWRTLGGSQHAQIEHKPAPQGDVGEPVEPISTAEELNDEINF